MRLIVTTKEQLHPFFRIWRAIECIENGDRSDDAFLMLLGGPLPGEFF